MAYSTPRNIRMPNIQLMMLRLSFSCLFAYASRFTLFFRFFLLILFGIVSWLIVISIIGLVVSLHQIGFDKAVELAVHHRLHVGSLIVCAVVFHAFVVENI